MMNTEDQIRAEYRELICQLECFPNESMASQCQKKLTLMQLSDMSLQKPNFGKAFELSKKLGQLNHSSSSLAKLAQDAREKVRVTQEVLEGIKKYRLRGKSFRELLQACLSQKEISEDRLSKAKREWRQFRSLFTRVPLYLDHLWGEFALLEILFHILASCYTCCPLDRFSSLQKSIEKAFSTWKLRELIKDDSLTQDLIIWFSLLEQQPNSQKASAMRVELETNQSSNRKLLTVTKPSLSLLDKKSTMEDTQLENRTLAEDQTRKAYGAESPSHKLQKTRSKDDHTPTTNCSFNENTDYISSQTNIIDVVDADVVSSQQTPEVQMLEREGVCSGYKEFEAARAKAQALLLNSLKETINSKEAKYFSKRIEAEIFSSHIGSINRYLNQVQRVAYFFTLKFTKQKVAPQKYLSTAFCLETLLRRADSQEEESQAEENKESLGKRQPFSDFAIETTCRRQLHSSFDTSQGINESSVLKTNQPLKETLFESEEAPSSASGDLELLADFREQEKALKDHVSTLLKEHSTLRAELLRIKEHLA